MRRVHLCLSALGTLVAFDSAAATLYKSIDANGRVTFSNVVPAPGERAQAMEIDTSVRPAPALIAPGSPEALRQQRTRENEEILLRRPSDDGVEVRLAERKLLEAKAALENAMNNSVAEDWIYLGGGLPRQGARPYSNPTRRMPTEEFAARLEALEVAIKLAEADLAAAERRQRLS
ncbi:MAG: DUF4124 domain-containing protein [Usitatibacter sp.]